MQFVNEYSTSMKYEPNEPDIVSALYWCWDGVGRAAEELRRCCDGSRDVKVAQVCQCKDSRTEATDCKCVGRVKVNREAENVSEVECLS